MGERRRGGLRGRGGEGGQRERDRLEGRWALAAEEHPQAEQDEGAARRCERKKQQRPAADALHQLKGRSRHGEIERDRE